MSDTKIVVRVTAFVGGEGGAFEWEANSFPYNVRMIALFGTGH